MESIVAQYCDPTGCDEIQPPEPYRVAEPRWFNTALSHMPSRRLIFLVDDAAFLDPWVQVRDQLADVIIRNGGGMYLWHAQLNGAWDEDRPLVFSFTDTSAGRIMNEQEFERECRWADAVVIFSNCISGRWFCQHTYDAIHTWSASRGLLLVNPLKHHKWRRTRLGVFKQVQIQDTKVVAGQQLHIPTIMPMAEELEQWAMWQSGARQNFPAFAIHEAACKRVKDVQLRTPEEEWSAFMCSELPRVRQFACFMALFPVITLPLVRIVAGNSGTAEDVDLLSDFILSSIVEVHKVNDTRKQDRNPDHVIYHIHPHAHEILLKSCTYTWRDMGRNMVRAYLAWLRSHDPEGYTWITEYLNNHPDAAATISRIENRFSLQPSGTVVHSSLEQLP